MEFNTDTKFVFFTGKGGVGKTTMACATAVNLAKKGKKVLLICTDPASNLSDVLEMNVTDEVSSHPKLSNLEVMNIIPEIVAKKYRAKVLDSLSSAIGSLEYQKVEEELSGACTVEIASFDEFSRYVAGDAEERSYDHIIFDTAPTGHTLRLLELPAAWGGYLEDHPNGASCIRPETGLQDCKGRYYDVVESLKDPSLTTMFLVSRTDQTSLFEASKTKEELLDIGLSNQKLIINGVFHAVDRSDDFALKMEANALKGLENIPENLQTMDHFNFPLLPYNVLGVEKLESIFDQGLQELITKEIYVAEDDSKQENLPDLDALVSQFESKGSGLIMTMGKGGVGKTIIASTLAVKLAQRGHPVLLTTTDPAAHIDNFIGTMESLPDTLEVQKIDPKVETERYVDRMVAKKSAGKTPEEIAQLREDLRSPCTEEIAVFLGFGAAIRKAKRQFVIMDTAPTGHTLLLLDTTGSYHNEVMNSSTVMANHITTPYMELQKPDFAKIIIVTLPEQTPINEADDLQKDLNRALIRPFAWVVNQTLSEVKGIKDPLLKAKASNEIEQINGIKSGLSDNVFGVPFRVENPILPTLI